MAAQDFCGHNVWFPMALKLKLIAVLATVLVTALLVPVSGTADDSNLQSLDTWGLSRGWEAVGLLNIAGRSTCTGVMIQADLVLTAAHCLYDKNTGLKTPPHLIEFRAGWRDGAAIARRFGKSAIIHPDYIQNVGPSGKSIRFDVALLQLAAPILATHANPFQVDGGVRTGHQVSVVSYGSGRNNAPSRQRSCDVLQARDGLVVMSCDVVPGSSGSPVFALRDGRQRIVSLVSALAHIADQQVSYGMDITRPLAQLLRDFKSGKGVYPAATFGAKRLTVGGKNSAGGAKFIKP